LNNVDFIEPEGFLMRAKTAFLITSLFVTPIAGYAEEHAHAHDHGAMSMDMSKSPSKTPLTEAGNDAFATIQEAVDKLMADPSTDWKHVDLEALRQHLIDMDNFTLHVKVFSQKPIKNGVEFIVRPTTGPAAMSLDRLMAAHPAILKQESGWDMQAKKIVNGYHVKVTSDNAADADKIRGLGYIGVVALGKHHQLHHWLMATGVNPHQHNHK
jgi:hypothetical protein